MKRLVMVVPCYNEEEVLPSSAEELLGVLTELIRKGKISNDSGILFVNDGSRDRTYEIISELHRRDPHFYGLNLAGNVGHQNALLAGLETAARLADITISIDADLQDDTAVIEKMVDRHLEEGADIVYGVRSSRETDSAFKRMTAQGFYKFMAFLGVKTVYNHADFRLMSRRAVEALLSYGERNLFLRGIVSQMGFKTASVTYSRKKRTAGESKYPLKKMLSFAFDGITSFSVRPISFLLGLGVLMMVGAIAAFVYIFISMLMGQTALGWPSLMASVWLLGGLQLFAIGIVGEYVGKTYIESKARPRYFILELLGHENDPPLTCEQGA